MNKHPHTSIDHYKDPAIARGFHDDRYGGTIGYWFMKSEQSTYADLAALLPSVDSVLDIGTGTGKLRESFPSSRFVGIDSSLPMLKTARELGGIRLLLAANCLQLPVGTDSFDLVVGSRLLMHIPSWRRFIRECCRVARSGIILDFPVRPSFAAMEPRIWNLSRRHDTHPVHRVFHRHEVITSFAENGFKCAALVRGFVLPYRFHRTLKSLSTSRFIERMTKRLGIAGAFGSPAYGLFIPSEK